MWFLFIALGTSVCLVVNMFIYPISGEDLHNLVANNFMGVTTSLESAFTLRFLHLLQKVKLLWFGLARVSLKRNYYGRKPETSLESFSMFSLVGSWGATRGTGREFARWFARPSLKRIYDNRFTQHSLRRLYDKDIFVNVFQGCVPEIK